MVNTLSIHLTDTSKVTTELIFSEPGGPVLLDTVGVFSDFSVGLKTNRTLLDFSYVRPDTGNTYRVNTFKSVDISAWTTVYRQSYALPLVISALPARQSATVLYTHMPLQYPNDPMVSNAANTGGANWTYPSATTALASYYLYYPNGYLYTAFPEQGLYKLHQVKGLTDTVDLAHMDTAVKINYDRPADLSITYVWLVGVGDTTDIYSKSVWLHNYGFTEANFPKIPIVLYPPKAFPKYQMILDATQKSISSRYYSYMDSVVTKITWPDASYFTYGSVASNAFSISFPKVRPSVYNTYWTNAKIKYWVYTSGDSTTLNADASLTGLKSKMLQGTALTGLTYRRLYVEAMTKTGYVDFNSFVQGNRTKTKYISELTSFGVTYQ
ncbi:MAG: hypothetical protein JST68_13975 [Bacteroidetes bacterium]|nr:hypothetical protein [Bacteroidota bacterium]